MEVRVGVRDVARELTFESSQSSAEVQEVVSAALSAPDGVISLVDDHGRMLMVPAASLGYVDIGVQEKGRVGFGSA